MPQPKISDKGSVVKVIFKRPMGIEGHKLNTRMTPVGHQSDTRMTPIIVKKDTGSTEKEHQLKVRPYIIPINEFYVIMDKPNLNIVERLQELNKTLDSCCNGSLSFEEWYEIAQFYFDW